MKSIIGTGLFVAGMIAMWALQSTVMRPPIPDGYYDLSILPEDFAKNFERKGFLYVLPIAYENEMERQNAAFMGERETRQLKPLPDGVPQFPNGKDLYQVLDGTAWPEVSDEGLQAQLDAAKGNWVVLNLWASWCGPCLKELPDMNEAVAPLSELGVSLIALNADIYERDTRESATQLFENKGLDNLTNLFAGEDDIESVLLTSGMPPGGNREFPTNIIFSPNGEPYAFFRGIPFGEYDGKPFWSSNEMIDFFEALVASDVT